MTFLDARKNDTMNVLGLRYMTLEANDGNNQFWPISHTIVFEEEVCVCGVISESIL